MSESKAVKQEVNYIEAKKQSLPKLLIDLYCFSKITPQNIKQEKEDEEASGAIEKGRGAVRIKKVQA